VSDNTHVGGTEWKSMRHWTTDILSCLTDTQLSPEIPGREQRLLIRFTFYVASKLYPNGGARGGTVSSVPSAAISYRGGPSRQSFIPPGLSFRAVLHCVSSVRGVQRCQIARARFHLWVRGRHTRRQRAAVAKRFHVYE
jgi:hypothetical protein